MLATGLFLHALNHVEVLLLSNLLMILPWMGVEYSWMFFLNQLKWPYDVETGYFLDPFMRLATGVPCWLSLLLSTPQGSEFVSKWGRNWSAWALEPAGCFGADRIKLHTLRPVAFQPSQEGAWRWVGSGARASAFGHQQKQTPCGPCLQQHLGGGACNPWSPRWHVTVLF